MIFTFALLFAALLEQSESAIADKALVGVVLRLSPLVVC